MKLFKKTQAFLILFFISFVSISQTTITIGEDYVFKTTDLLYPYDLKTRKIDSTASSLELAPVGGRFEIVDEIKDFYIIQFYEWTVTRKSKSKNNAFYKNQLYKAKTFNYITIDTTIRRTATFKRIVSFGIATKNKTIFSEQIDHENNIKSFAGRKSDLDKKSVSIEAYSRWTATSGALVMPFKLRTQRGDFTKDVSVNGIVGIGYKLNKNNVINIIGGIGIASVTLDSLNTGGKVRKATDRAAMSLCAGPLYQYKQIQLGIMFGWDILNKSSEDDWVYNGKMWLSFGVGVNLFKPDDKKDKLPNISN